MRVQTSYAIERDGVEYDCVVVGDVQPITRGRYSGPPELCYPDEGGEVEITRILVVHADGVPVSGQTVDPDTLTNGEIDAIEDLLRDDVESCEPEPPSYDWADENDRWEAQAERDRWAGHDD